jgi:hypothetical protein
MSTETNQVPQPRPVITKGSSKELPSLVKDRQLYDTSSPRPSTRKFRLSDQDNFSLNVDDEKVTKQHAARQFPLVKDRPFYNFFFLFPEKTLSKKGKREITMFQE